MRTAEQIDQYRKLDKELSDVTIAARDVFRDKESEDMEVPKLGNQEEANRTLDRLSAQAQSLPNADDPVFSLIRGHFEDFLESCRIGSAAMYDRPNIYLGWLASSVSDAVRTDSRPDKVKLGSLQHKYGQVDEIWNAVTSWIDNVSPVNIQEFLYGLDNFNSTMDAELTRLNQYFPELSQAERDSLKDSINSVRWKTEAWKARAGEALVKAQEKHGTFKSSDDDIIVMEEEAYRNVLKSRGVNLDELLSWHEREIQKTRNDVFEICSRLNITERNAKTMKEVSEVLFKYAGPADSPEEMFRRGHEYIKRSQAAARDYVWLPPDETCLVLPVYENLKFSYPWGGYGGGCGRRRPVQGHMFLNDFNFKAVTDGWIKMNTVHESYPGHHVQFVRRTLDPIPETFKKGAKSVPLSEGTAHRSERVFEFVFPEDPFYPLFVAYRRHHTSVRIKADLMLRYFGNPIKDAVKLYMDELGFDYQTARGQVKAQETMQGYFTCYYYGMKTLTDWEEKYGFGKREYTELLFSVGNISLESFHKYIMLNTDDKRALTHDFGQN